MSGDVVMVARGFDMQHLLASKCVALNIPPVLQGKEQLSLEEEVEIRSIAPIHIHVERAIERVKYYHTLQGVIPISLHAYLEMKFGLLIAYINYKLSSCNSSVI